MIEARECLWRLAKSFQFALEMCLWGLVVGAFVFAPYTARLAAPIGLAKVDPSRNDTLVLEASMCSTRGNIFERFWCFDFQAMNFVSNIPCCLGMFGLPYLLNVRFSFLQGLGFAVMVVSAYVVQVGYFENNEAQVIRNRLLVSFSCLSYLAPIYLKALRPGDCGVWKTALLGALVTTSGCMLSATFDRIAKHRLLFTILFVPLIRELILTPTRLWSKMLMINAEIAGKDDHVRRTVAWCFMFIGQVFCATWVRMIVSSFGDSSKLALYLCFSAILEFTARISISWRDRVLVQTFPSWIPFGESQATVAPVSHQEVVNKKMTESEWMSLVVMLDILSEYVGIFFNLFAIVAFRSKKLVMPVQFFAEEKNLQFATPLAGVFLNTGSQVVVEIIVDGCSLLFETSFLKIPVYANWRRISFRVRFLGAIFAGLIGVSNAITVMRTSQFTCGKQTSFDICACRYIEGGLYDYYCSNHHT